MIVIDTHILLWWLDGGERLSKVAQNEIEAARKSGNIHVSAMSVWEVALLVKKNRVKIEMDVKDWLRRVEGLDFVSLVPVSARIALESINLPGVFHKDPADRIIVATARQLGAKLVTKDEKILKYAHIQAVW